MVAHCHVEGQSVLWTEVCDDNCKFQASVSLPAWYFTLHFWLSLLSPDSIRELVHSYPRTMSAYVFCQRVPTWTFSWQERMCVSIPWVVFWILVHNNEPRFCPPWQCAQETLHPQHVNVSRKLWNSAPTSTFVHQSTVLAPTRNTAVF
jgi:hypothetical protein